MAEMYHFENLTINRKCNNSSVVTNGTLKIEDDMLKIVSSGKVEVKKLRWLDIDLNKPLVSGPDLLIRLKTGEDRYINVQSRRHQQQIGFVEAFNKMREQFRDESTKNTALPKTPFISLNDAPNSSESSTRYSTKSHRNPTSSTNNYCESRSKELNRSIEKNSVMKGINVSSPRNFSCMTATRRLTSSSSKQFPSQNTYSSHSHSISSSSQSRILGNTGARRKYFSATVQSTETNPISKTSTKTDQMRGSVSEVSSASTSQSSSPLSSHGIQLPLRSQNTQCGSPHIESSILPESNYVTPKVMKTGSLHTSISTANSPAANENTERNLHAKNNEPYQNLSKVSRERSFTVEQNKRDLSGADHKKVQPLVQNRKLSNIRFSDRILPNTGNSCYFNSIMQAISSCPPIVSRCTQLYRLKPKKLVPSFAHNLDGTSVDLSEKWEVVEGVISILSMLLNKSEKNEILTEDEAKKRLKDIRRSMGRIEINFDNDEQQDAHDYLMQVFRCFDEVMKEDARKDFQQSDSPQNSILQLNPNIAVRFKTEQFLYCPTCKKENINTSFQEILQIPLKYEKSTKLCDLLKAIFQGYTVERKCSQCECTIAYARDRISRFPQCLVMNLQRYRNIFQKNESRVEIPFKLDVSRFRSFTEFDFDFNGNFIELNTRDESAYKSDNTSTLNDSITCGISKESGTPKLLGGAEDAESGSDDDCEILAEKVKFSFNFKLITHRKNVLEMVGKMEITANEESIKQHLKTLRRSPTMELDKKDEPGAKIKIETDGNCFFRAISWCLTGSQKYHKKVRKATVSFMKISKQLLENNCNGNYEIHVDNMEHDQQWATECEIAAVANLLRVNIYTYLPTGWNCQTPKESVPTNIGSIYLNNQEEHYEPVVSLKKSSQQPEELKSHKRKPLDGDDDQGTHDKKKVRKVDGDPTEDTKPDVSSSRKNPRRSCNEKTKQNSNSIPYNLVAAVCHKGHSLSNGHYYAYVKDMYSANWNYSSDKTFRAVHKEENFIDKIASEAYVLFYDRQ